MENMKYYYMTGEGQKESDFIEYENIQELANEHYNGDVNKALDDTMYVFDNDEYEAWIDDDFTVEIAEISTTHGIGRLLYNSIDNNIVGILDDETEIIAENILDIYEARGVVMQMYSLPVWELEMI